MGRASELAFSDRKHSLPFLRTGHTSLACFADEFPAGESLGEYVLKPLYSFAGLGVDMAKTHIDCVGRDFDIWFDGEKVMERGKFLL